MKYQLRLIPVYDDVKGKGTLHVDLYELVEWCRKYSEDISKEKDINGDAPFSATVMEITANMFSRWIDGYNKGEDK